MRRALAAGAVALLLMTGLSGCGLINSWFDKGVEIVSPENVEEQFDRVITNWEALTVTAVNACGAQKESESDNGPTLVESPAFAYIATYLKVRAAYNAAQDDLFKAQIVGPPGYPDEVPLWEDVTTGDAPDFCEVSTRLAELKDDA